MVYLKLKLIKFLIICIFGKFYSTYLIYFWASFLQQLFFISYQFFFLVYLETARKTTDQILKFTIGATTTVATWRIKVAQVESFSTSK